ncbi:MAG: DNA adenine methylase [Candidatus Eisenbacteria bacterium]
MLGELALGNGLGLGPLLRWPGGKARFAGRVVPRIPKHRVYCEPFFGGGALFFAKPEAKVSILGDVTKKTIAFHDQVRRGALRRCREGVTVGPAAFKKGEDGKAKSACDVLAWTMSSYHGSITPSGRSSKHGGRQKMRHLKEYEGMLRRAFLTLGDFARTVSKADRRGGREAFYFLDPPWPGLQGYSKKYTKMGGADEKGATPARVRKVMDDVKGKVWVVYNDHPEVREAFCEGKKGKWKCYGLKQNVQHGTGGMQKKPWILATNYNLKGKR